METKIEAGSEVWAVERDEVGLACEVSGYMFLAEVAGFVITTPYISGTKHIESIMAYHAQMTAENYDTDLAVLPAKDCWPTREAALTALEEEGGAR